MVNGYTKIKFEDEIYYFDGEDLNEGGCIELQPDMSDNGFSWAYLNPAPDSKIMRYHSEIGNINDIEIINEE